MNNATSTTRKKDVKFAKVRLREELARTGLSLKDYYRSVYLLSSHWSGLRQEALNRANRRCSQCRRRKNLHVHHTNYRSLFDVIQRDLQVLCEECHADAHGIEVKVSRSHVLTGIPKTIRKEYRHVEARLRKTRGNTPSKSDVASVLCHEWKHSGRPELAHLQGLIKKKAPKQKPKKRQRKGYAALAPKRSFICQICHNSGLIKDPSIGWLQCRCRNKISVSVVQGVSDLTSCRQAALTPPGQTSGSGIVHRAD